MSKIQKKRIPNIHLTTRRTFESSTSSTIFSSSARTFFVMYSIFLYSFFLMIPPPTFFKFLLFVFVTTKSISLLRRFLIVTAYPLPKSSKWAISSNACAFLLPFYQERSFQASIRNKTFCLRILSVKPIFNPFLYFNK